MISFRHYVKKYLEESMTLDMPYGKNNQDKMFRVNSSGRWITTQWIVDGVQYQGEFMHQDPADWGVDEYAGLPNFYTYEFQNFDPDHRKPKSAMAVMNTALTVLFDFCRKYEPNSVISEPATLSHKKLYKSAASNPRIIKAFKGIGYRIGFGNDPNGLRFGDFFFVEKDT